MLYPLQLFIISRLMTDANLPFRCAGIHEFYTVRLQTSLQRLISAVSPSHGRVLIYVWAVEQDGLSKRAIPRGISETNHGEDVFVPWVLSKDAQGNPKQPKEENSETQESLLHRQETKTRVAPQIFNRYYHMFARGELTELVTAAASSMELQVGPPGPSATRGIEVVHGGWERSNYYVELRRWQSN